jgi:hypothetical protein
MLDGKSRGDPSSRQKWFLSNNPRLYGGKPGKSGKVLGKASREIS